MHYILFVFISAILSLSGWLAPEWWPLYSKDTNNNNNKKKWREVCLDKNACSTCNIHDIRSTEAIHLTLFEDEINECIEIFRCYVVGFHFYFSSLPCILLWSNNMPLSHQFSFSFSILHFFFDMNLLFVLILCLNHKNVHAFDDGRRWIVGHALVFYGNFVINFYKCFEVVTFLVFYVYHMLNIKERCNKNKTNKNGGSIKIKWFGEIPSRNCPTP